MRYMLLLYKYVSNHSVKSIRVLEEFIGFLNDNKIDIKEADKHTDEFKETDYFSKKTEKTQNNYIREINKFVDTVYREEGYRKAPTISHTKNVNDKVIVEEVKRDESDPEYQEFLRRYEDVCRRLEA